MASTCPANIVDAREKSVVDAIEDNEPAGEGVLGNVLNGGSCCSLCTAKGGSRSGRKQAGEGV